MSLILDALKRAEAGRGRDLGQRLAQALPPHARRRKSTRRVATVLVVTATAAVAAWFALVPTERPPDAVAAPAAVPAQQAVEATPPRVAEGSSLDEIPLPVAVPAAAPQRAPAPLLEQLPAEIRGAVPRIAVNAHFWSADPARRFIVIDMQRYRDGDAIRDGLMVVRVVEEGAELEWRGTRFRVSSR